MSLFSFFKNKFYLIFINILLASFLCIIIYILDFVLFTHQIENIALDEAKKELKSKEATLKKIINNSAQLLYAINNSEYFKLYKDSNNSNIINSNFQSIIFANNNILQLRYIDKYGMEKARVDYDKKTSKAVLVDELQDKSQRYYFKNSISKSDIWFSNIDLNMEYGQVQIPYQATLRAILPIIDDEKFNGILVMNFDMNKIFKQLFTYSNYNIILFDNHFNTLYHHNEKFAWSNYDKNITINNKYKEKYISNSSKGDNYVIKEITIPFLDNFILVYELKDAYIHKQKQLHLNRFFISFIIIVLVSIISSIFLYKFINKKSLEIEKLNKEKEQKDKFLREQTKLASMGRMIRAIAHQWRQPLNSLNGILINIIDAKNFGQLDDKYFEEQIQKAENTIVYMSETIEDFSNFFKPNKDKKTFFLDETIKSTLEMIQERINSNNISIKLQNLEHISYYGFKNELQQVLINILNNSIDAFKTKTLNNKYISISLNKSNLDIIISITDNAGGIPPQILDKIFEPYFSTKDEKNGTGLGLYMSKAIIETSMNGKFEIISKGKLTTCNILLGNNDGRDSQKLS